MALVISTRDPAADRFAALLQTAIFSPLGMLVGLIAAGLVASWSTLLGWLIVVIATAMGLIPLLIWRFSRQRPDHISVWDLNSTGRRIIGAAGESVRRIETAMAGLDEGPAADHLDLAHRVAIEYVRAIGAACRAPAGEQRIGAGAPRTAEIESISRALVELADEAEALARAARPKAPVRLRELTEQTRLIRHALEEQIELDHPTALNWPGLSSDSFSACEAGDERVQESDSTTDR